MYDFPVFRQVSSLTAVQVLILPLFFELGTKTSASDLHMKETWLLSDCPLICFHLFFLQCAALVGEDQPLCPDLPELDLSELDVSDLDADSFLGGLKWYSDQSEIISAQYGNEASNLFEVSRAFLHSSISPPCCTASCCFWGAMEHLCIHSDFITLSQGSGVSWNNNTPERTRHAITMLNSRQTKCTTQSSK